MHTVAQVRDLLPGWVGWLGPGSYYLAVLLISWFWLRVTSWRTLRPLRAARLRQVRQTSEAERVPLHWSERARLGFAVRRSYAVMVLLLMVIFGATAMFWCGPAAWLSGWQLPALVVISQLLLGVVGYRRWVLVETVDEVPPWRYHLAGMAVTMLLMRPASMVLLVAMACAPQRLVSWQAALWLVVLLAVLVSLHFGAGLKLLRTLGLAWPAGPRLRAAVDRAAAQAGHAAKAVAVLRWPTANAIALPMAQLLAFSDRALKEHPDAELTAIAAHELGHLSEPAAVQRLRLLSSLVLVGLAAMPTLVRDAGPWVALVVLLVVLGFAVAVRRYTRKMETRADAHAHDHGDPTVYAEALERLYRVNGVPAVMRAATTHPHLYDRLVATGNPPDFERPAPPPSFVLSWLVPVAVATLLATGAATMWVQYTTANVYSEHGAYTSLAVSYGDDGSMALSHLATWRMLIDPAAADRLFDTAEALTPYPEELYWMRAHSLVGAHRCEEAQHYLGELRVTERGRQYFSQGSLLMESLVAEVQHCDAQGAAAQSPVPEPPTLDAVP